MIPTRVNVCIFGVPGIGKSPLDNLFRPEVERIEPYRARKGGAREVGEKYYVSPDMLEKLLFLNRSLYQTPIFYLDSDKDCKPYLIAGKEYRKWLEVYPRMSFFLVRGTAQVLLHPQEIKPDNRKIEIFAPVLFLVLQNEETRDAIHLFQETMTIFILLNPLAESILNIDPTQIINGAGWRREQWEEIQEKRDRLASKKVISSEIKERVDLLPIEAEAWQSLADLAKKNSTDFGFVECREWTHFEYKYLENGGLEAVKEFTQARADILKAAKEVDLAETLQKCLM